MMWYSLQSGDPRGIGSFQREVIRLRLEVWQWEHFKVLTLAFSMITVYVHGAGVESWSRKKSLKSGLHNLLHMFSGMHIWFSIVFSFKKNVTHPVQLLFFH